MLMRPYTPQFFDSFTDASQRSAGEIVPIILELVGPRRVVDVGCGVGTWLAVFSACGVEAIQGIDGAYVDEKALLIPRERFIAHDLRQPLHLNEQFDLVVSLEVAEHLPPECAEAFVDSLVRLGPVVMFSAAIPYQGGNNHLNEQWQDYWAGLFQQRDYLPIDCIRRRVWQNSRVDYWYAQNTLVYARRDYLTQHPTLRREFENTNPLQLSVVHPRLYLWQMRLTDRLGVRRLWSALPFAARHALKRRVIGPLLKR
jgi:SAM-dependent methyltransferase